MWAERGGMDGFFIARLVKAADEVVECASPPCQARELGEGFS
jgi:hypothetical protein